jgi:drug/metabolite transporter (DMT)-like permease
MSDNPARSVDNTRYRLAIVLMFVSSVGFSLNGLIVRSLEDASPWQVLFWRGCGVFLGQGLILAWIYRARLPRQFVQIGRWGVVAMVLNGCTPAAFLFALTHTTVANVVFLLSAMPFVSAIMARVVLGERIHRTTLFAIPIAFVGIVVMVGGSILAGAWLGNVFALVTVLSFSMFVVILRYSRGRNMQPVLVLGGVMSMTFAFVVTGGEIAVSLHDWALCFTLGFVITGFGHLMFMKAAQILPAGEVTFLMLIEFVMAPLWVWIFVNEVPRTSTLIGGGIVLAAVTGWAYYRLRAAQRVSPETELSETQ